MARDIAKIMGLYGLAILIGTGPKLQEQEL